VTTLRAPDRLTVGSPTFQRITYPLQQQRTEELEIGRLRVWKKRVGDRVRATGVARRVVRALFLRSLGDRLPEAAPFFRADGPAALLEPLLYARGPARVRRRRTRSCDVVFVAPGVAPELVKDMVVLRRLEPQLRCVVLTMHAGPNDALAGSLAELRGWRTLGELATELASLEARSLVATCRGSSRYALAPGVLWSGRFVYRPYPFAHRESDGRLDALEAESERWVLNRADAVYHFFADEAVDGLRAQLGFRCPAAAIPPACVPELGPSAVRERLASLDGGPHVAYVAGFNRRGEQLAPYLETLPAKLGSLLEAGYHVHVYGRGASADDFHESLAEVVSHPCFHVEPPRAFDKLLDELTAYDWGFYDFDIDRVGMRPGFERFASNGFYTYLQAGVPVIVSPTTPTYTELTERFGAGLVFAGAPEALGAALAQVDAEAARAGAVQAREHLVVDERRLHEVVFGAGG